VEFEDEAGGPGRRSFHVDVAGVGGPRNQASRTALVALVVLAAILCGGILAGQLFPVDQGVANASPSSGTASPPASGLGVAIASPVPSGGLAPLTPRITASPVDAVALVAAVPRHGTGPLAFVAGRLVATPRPCGRDAPLSACLTLRIVGLRGVPVVADDTMGSWPGDPPPGQTLVLLPRDGRLVFLGSLDASAAGIPRIDMLQAITASDPAAAATLFPSLREADGMLITDTGPCASGASCPPLSAALLRPWRDLVDVSRGTGVTLAPGAFGVSAGGWTSGPFLLRYRPDAEGWILWQVAAREDQGSILHVAIP
jgi:hypothetical protein